MTALKNYPLLFIFLLAFISCSSSEIGESKDVNQETIYQEYKIEFNEAEKADTVEVWAQFRFAGSDGTTLVLNNPSKIEFDGTAIPVDSNEYRGAFYRFNTPVKDFFTRHHFTFTNVNNKKYQNDFSFDAFKLLTVPPVAVATQPLNIPFETAPLQADDYIEVNAVNTDSSFTVKFTAADAGNSITIPVNELQRQKGKELSLSVVLYRKIPLYEKTKEGGQIEIFYTLKPVTIKLANTDQYTFLFHP